MVALSHHNLANAARDLGDHTEARSHYAASLRIYRDYDDRWALGMLLDDLVLAVAQAGIEPPERMFEVLGVADRLREETESARDTDSEQALAEAARRCAPGLTPDEQLAARERGRSLVAAAALELALKLVVVEDA